MSLVLLGTEGCHLCEEAQALILRLDGKIPWDVFLQDIGESEQMVERYGERIPVLRYEAPADGQDAELDWPFDEQDVLEFVHNISQT
ncbi:MAG: thioredoxin family protein [Oceanospirillaceae bacterium]|nr:thioredoxin family protein [Oceanospirillaceae bacterium]MBT13383.1 thioredoxin family protein [Oceanospirillaceae bacterium]|tara:strand:- start:345 stop:605 length:261 start_codon:yes stop_codon:yes gene_type:complete